MNILGYQFTGKLKFITATWIFLTDISVIVAIVLRQTKATSHRMSKSRPTEKELFAIFISQCKNICENFVLWCYTGGLKLPENHKLISDLFITDMFWSPVQKKSQKSVSLTILKTKRV